MCKTNHTEIESGFDPSRHASLTSAEDDALVRNLVSCLEARAVPAMPPELVLTLVDGDLDALDGRGCDVWVSHAHVHLPLGESRECETHRVGIEDGLHVLRQTNNGIGICPGREVREREVMSKKVTSP